MSASPDRRAIQQTIQFSKGLSRRILCSFIILLAVLIIAACRASPNHDRKEETLAGRPNNFYIDKPRLMAQSGHAVYITSVAISHDNQLLLTGDSRGTAILWNIETEKQIQSFYKNYVDIDAVGFSEDDRFLFTRNGDKTFRYWCIATGLEKPQIDKERIDGDIVAWSSDGPWMLVKYLDGTVSLVNTATNEKQSLIGLVPTNIPSATFSSNGRWLLINCEDGIAQLWDMTKCKKHSQFFLPTKGLALSNTGERAITRDGLDVSVIDTNSGSELTRFTPEWVTDVDFFYNTMGLDAILLSPDGQKVLTAYGYNAGAVYHPWISYRLWDVNTREVIIEQELDNEPSEVFSFSPDSRYLAVAVGRKQIEMYDVQRKVLARSIFRELPSRILSVAFSHDDRFLILGNEAGRVHLWDALNRSCLLHEFVADHVLEISSIAFSQPDSKFILAGSRDQDAFLWERDSRSVFRRFIGTRNLVRNDLTYVDKGQVVAFSPDGSSVLKVNGDGAVLLFNIVDGKLLHRFEGHKDPIRSVAFSPNGKLIATADWDKVIRLWNTEDYRLIDSIEDFNMTIDSIAFSPDSDSFVAGDAVAFAPNGDVVLTAGGSAILWDVVRHREIYGFEGYGEDIVSLWDIKPGFKVQQLDTRQGWVTSVTFSNNGKFILIGGGDGVASIWSTATAKELCRLISRGEEELGSTTKWMVVTPEGHFDTNDLEETQSLHWVMPDDPTRPLPIEIFMRDYYEPQLLARILAGEQLPAVRSLLKLNRVQPSVNIEGVWREDDKANTVDIAVEVAAARGNFNRDGKTSTMTTGVYDLRIFRDGQMVAQMPAPKEETLDHEGSSETELREWRRAHELPLDPKSGKRTIFFQGIRLPGRAELERVEFSAYAFNEDRVKSTTARKIVTIPKELRSPPRQGRAYIISVGVNAYETADWDLQYAAKDAELFSDVVKRLLEMTENYAEVIPVRLISDRIQDQNGRRKVIPKDATKATFKTVLDLLAGNEADSRLLSGISNAGRLRPASPEDLVLISISSHGYADAKGTFYFFPYDIGSQAGRRVNPELLRRTISSDELSNWMRKIDAGELVMVIDACHSAASVERTGFKPGPMGARGLGQLAYDKGMRILASTRADDVAWESPLTRQGLLSYALIQNGLVEKHADFDPADKKILLSEWLRYAVKRVPELYAEARSGQVKGAGEKIAKLISYRRGVKIEYYSIAEIQATGQQPTLFDFRRTISFEPLIMRLDN